MNRKAKVNLENVLKNYEELTENEKEQLRKIYGTKSIPIVERKRIIKEIIYDYFKYGQDLKIEEIKNNINSKEKIKYLLDRLFVEDIHVSAIDMFIRNVKNNQIDLSKFLKIHKEYPTKHYLRLIQMP